MQTKLCYVRFYNNATARNQYESWCMYHKVTLPVIKMLKILSSSTWPNPNNDKNLKLNYNYCLQGIFDVYGNHIFPVKGNLLNVFLIRLRNYDSESSIEFCWIVYSVLVSKHWRRRWKIAFKLQMLATLCNCWQLLQTLAIAIL